MSDDFAVMAAWTGEAFRPLGRGADAARERFEIGERVGLTAEKPRNMAAHRGYFARVHEGWLSLPEAVLSAPYARSSESLRKHALISTGFAHFQTHVASSRAEAERVAVLVPSIHRDYCVTTIQGTAVLIATAESQSVRAMGAQRFRRSCDAVEGWIEALLAGEAA